MRTKRCPMLLVGLVFFSGLPSTVSGATPEEPASEVDPVAGMCKLAQCRYDVRVTLRGEGGEVFDSTFEALPVVQPAGVAVYAGQTVLFEAEVEDRRLTNLRLVERMENPERTLTAKLVQSENGGMMLTTTNPFGKPLRMRMGMMPLALDRLVATSSCPVIAGGSSHELWSFPIFQVFLADLRLMEDHEPMECVE